MTISYHMQFDTIDDHFVPYAESYEDSTFILILHHIQINVIPKYAACWYSKKYVFKTGKKTEKKKYIHVYYVIVYYHIF